LLKVLEMVAWQLVFSRQAQKDARKAAEVGLRPNIERLLAVLVGNPFQNPPPFEKLVGYSESVYSRRINIQHRLVYQVIDKQKTVKVLRMWSHYE
jgi:toxin YoeB